MSGATLRDAVLADNRRPAGSFTDEFLPLLRSSLPLDAGDTAAWFLEGVGREAGSSRQGTPSRRHTAAGAP